MLASVSASQPEIGADDGRSGKVLKRFRDVFEDQGSTPYELTKTLLQWCTHPIDYQLHCKRQPKKN